MLKHVNNEDTETETDSSAIQNIACKFHRFFYKT